MSARIIAVYRVKSDAASIEARARGIALEQSIEAPLEAVRDAYVAREIVGEPGAIREAAAGVFEVEIALSAATTADLAAVTDSIGSGSGQFACPANSPQACAAASATSTRRLCTSW